MDIHRFQEHIWLFYNQNQRPFPWRETTDPYAITVSEIMLQQTQTERVVPKYEHFLQVLPNWEALAQVGVSELLQLWQGLGYNRRALALKRMAEVVVQEHGGKLPTGRESLQKLPGIGPYTAGAILAFAFNQPVIFIETNIRRVFIHHFFVDKEGVKDRELLPCIEAAVDKNNPREWYYALMDYGAWLTKQLPNPNRRSAHYTKQAKFEGSLRQIRGRILRVLVDRPRLERTKLYEMLDTTPQRADEALQQMQREGFLIAENEEVYLAS